MLQSMRSQRGHDRATEGQQAAQGPGDTGQALGGLGDTVPTTGLASFLRGRSEDLIQGSHWRLSKPPSGTPGCPGECCPGTSLTQETRAWTSCSSSGRYQVGPGQVGLGPAWPFKRATGWWEGGEFQLPSNRRPWCVQVSGRPEATSCLGTQWLELPC